MAMLAPRKFMQKRKKVEVFKDEADEAYPKNWRRLMNEIEEAGTAVEVLRRERIKNQALPRELVLGTLKKFKQMKRWNLVSEMQRAGLRPDDVSYALLVNAYGKARREDEALHVFEEMLSAGVRCTPNLCSYTTMLSAYVNAPDMDGAEKFFRRLKQDGLSPNEVTYGALIKGYAKANDLEKLMAKYEEMRSCGIRANQTVLTTIMDAYGKNKYFDSAVIWYKEMESSGLAPDKKANNVLLSLAKSNEELQEANMLVGNKDWVSGVLQSNAKLTFTYGKAVDEDNDNHYDNVEDEDADDREDDDYCSDDAEEAFSVGAGQGLSSMSYAH